MWHCFVLHWKKSMNQKNTGDDPTIPWPFKIQKRKQELLCTQSIIQQKGRHNALRTEDGKIPCGYKVGGKTNLKRHLKAKQTALLFVWISQLTGMSLDQFLMTNIFKCWRSGRTGSAAQHGLVDGWFAGASHHQRTQNYIPGHLHPDIATE